MCEYSDMDDVSEDNLIHLQEYGKRIAEEFNDNLDEFIKILIE